MINPYVDMYDFDHWANMAVYKALPETMLPTDRAMALLSHVANAKRLWLLRLQGGAYQGIDPHSTMSRAELSLELNCLEEEWSAYLAKMDVTWLAAACSYTDTKGKAHKSPVGDILIHVVNHGTHHRAQIAATLRELGHAPPSMDFIVYSRSKRK